MATADLLDCISLAKTAGWRNVDLKTLRGEIIPRDGPAVPTQDVARQCGVYPEPLAALAHGLMAITPRSASRRELWRKMFEHYVFQTGGAPIPYLAPDRRGMLGTLSPGLQTHIRTLLIGSLTKPMPAQHREQILRLLWPLR